MEERTIMLRFPFSVEGKEHTAELRTGLTRREGAVTFTLPFPCFVSAVARDAYKVHYLPSGTASSERTIVIEFKNINDAISFCAHPEVLLGYMPENQVVPIDEEIREIAEKLEETEAYWKKRKRAQEEDEDGYVTVR